MPWADPGPRPMLMTALNAAQTAHVAFDRARTRAPARVGYIGGHGGGNLGDDLMLGLARRLFPDRRLVDCAESWHERRLARLGLSGPRYFDHVLLGGGTLISPFWYGKVEAAIGQGLPVSSLGSGAGSCGFIQPDGVDLSAWAPLLKRFANLGVRGPRSLATLRRLGVEHAEVVGDLALALTRDAPHPADATPTIAVNLSLPAPNEPQGDEAVRFDELLEALRPLTRRGWAVRPYAMNPADLAPTRGFVERLCGRGVPVPHLDSVAGFMDYVGPSTLNVTVRLHGAILGCCAGVPPVMLGYRDKCLDFAESIGMADACVYLPAARTGEVTLAVGRGLETAEADRRRVLARCGALRDRLMSYVRRVGGGGETP